MLHEGHDAGGHEPPGSDRPPRTGHLGHLHHAAGGRNLDPAPCLGRGHRVGLYSAARVDTTRAALWIGSIQVARDGGGTGVSKDEARAQMHASEVTMRVDLGLGSASARAWGCDLTEAYVVENSAYST